MLYTSLTIIVIFFCVLLATLWLRREILFQLRSHEKGLHAEFKALGVEGNRHFDRVTQLLNSTALQLQSVHDLRDSVRDLDRTFRLPTLRGAMGEVQLERLLRDFLPQAHYKLQAKLNPDSRERVDALVKLDKDWLPIDSKFPVESFLRKLADTEQQAETQKEFYRHIKACAKSISEKYIKPEWGTSPMALLFLPSESLYLEALSVPELQAVWQQYKVWPSSPNTLSLMLSAIQMAIQSELMAKSVESSLQALRQTQAAWNKFDKDYSSLIKDIRRLSESYAQAETSRLAFKRVFYQEQDETINYEQASHPN